MKVLVHFATRRGSIICNRRDAASPRAYHPGLVTCPKCRATPAFAKRNKEYQPEPQGGEA